MLPVPRLLPILTPYRIAAPAMPVASLRPSADGRGFCLILDYRKLKIEGDIIMTRSDLLTLSPRLARKELVHHICLFLEPLPGTASDLSEKQRYYIRATCDLCPASCEMSFISHARLSYAYADGLVEPFYLLCRRLGTAPVDVDFAARAGQKQVTSAASN